MSVIPAQKPASPLHTSGQRVFWMGSGLFLAGLIALMVSGWFARYLQDDYCFDFLLKRGDFWNAQVFTFLNEVTFNGNRISTNLVMGILAQVGPLSARLVPGFLVLSWLTAAYWLLLELSWLLDWHWPTAFLFFCSTLIVLFSLVQAPNLYQVLFWRPAAITYLMPLVLLTFLCALNFHLIRNDQLSLGFLIISGLLAFWVGAFSETAAVFQFGLLMELILWLRIKKPFGPHLQLSAVRYFKAAGVGSSLAILVLIAAPSAHLRQAALFPQPPWLLEMFRISVDGIHQFLLLTLYRQTIPTLLTFLTFFFAGFLFSHSSQKTFSLPRPRLWVHLLIATLGGFVLLLCIYLPSAYASSSPPEQRALLWARFTLVGVELLISMIMGDWMGRTFKRLTRRRSLVALGLFLALASILFIAFVPAKVAFQPAFPEIRNWLKQEPYRWGIVILLFLFSFWIVTHIKLEKSSMEEWVPLLLAVLILSMALFSLPGIFKAIPEYQLRAQLWDWRDARIRSAIQRGMYEIELPAVDSIADVAELQADANYWVNNCAERFYGMKSIRAVPPALTGIPPDE